MYGGVKLKDRNGNEVLWVWDYAKDEPRIKSEMTQNELLASECAKWEGMKDQFDKKQ